MERIIRHEKYGQITYRENFWTGRVSLEINGQPLTKTGRKLYAYTEGERSLDVRVKGSLLLGATLTVDSDVIIVQDKPKFYEYALTLFIFVFNLIWGNVVALFTIMPIVGGAIGGGITGACAIMCLFLMRKTNKFYWKVLIFMVFFAISVLLCWVVALAMLGKL